MTRKTTFNAIAASILAVATLAAPATAGTWLPGPVIQTGPVYVPTCVTQTVWTQFGWMTQQHCY